MKFLKSEFFLKIWCINNNNGKKYILIVCKYIYLIWFIGNIDVVLIGICYVVLGGGVDFLWDYYEVLWV